MSKSATKLKDYASFQCKEDAARFLNLILLMPPSQEKYFVLLQLLIPAQPSEWVNAKWECIDFVNGVWVINPASKFQTNLYPGIQVIPKVTYLSEWAMQLLSDLRFITGNYEQLFPMLSALKKNQREQIIADFVRLWRPYHVDVNSFREFFTDVCNTYSGFKPNFVREVVKSLAKTLTFSDVIQRRALIEYWSCELSRHLPTPQYSPNM